ncbi:cell division protein BlhA [Acinetobacter schindleri]|uniref:cell division protein BlhA n=1 Tax=Acinetobacter schindleri TaxID=108981 RepID=UPI0030FC217D
MALNVGPDFKQRWLNVPEAVRQTFIDDLARICDVLQPEISLQEWLVHDQQLQKESERKIEEAYAQRKAELIEEARIRKQQALEKALADKRAQEQAYIEQMKLDEERKYAEQTRTLELLRDSLNAEVLNYAARFEQNRILNSAQIKIDDTEILSELESTRLRLELEAETAIEETLVQLRNRLRAAAREEIDYILQKR